MAHPPKNKQRAKPSVAQLQHTSLFMAEIAALRTQSPNKIGVLYHDPSR